MAWGPPQQTAFDQLKGMLLPTACLTKYDPTSRTVVSLDASSFGLGGCGGVRVLAYASGSLLPAGAHCSQAEKEALAPTWMAERVNKFLRGLHFRFGDRS